MKSIDSQNLFALKSTRVVTPQGEVAASVIIENGIIREVTQNAVADDLPQIDFGDRVVSPGLIDTHVHINDPGTDWEGFESATRAAAAGGVTTLIDMPLNSMPVTTTTDALQIKRRAAKVNAMSMLDFTAEWCRVTETNLRR